MELEEALEILKQTGHNVIDEDFGIGVGAPCGLDQGIPHGGDCKGCCPQRMGLLYQRSPYSINPLYKGVPDAHHPSYWLNQIPKKKKHKKLKKRKLHESNFNMDLSRYADKTDSIMDFKEACFRMYCKYFRKDDLNKRDQTDHDLRKDFSDGFIAVKYRATRAATAGRWARAVAAKLDHAGENIGDCLKKFKEELQLLKHLTI